MTNNDETWVDIECRFLTTDEFFYLAWENIPPLPLD